MKNKNVQYAGFVDDDCVIDENWLLNMIKFFDQNNCDIVGGPQYHDVKNKVFKNYYNVLEPTHYHGQLVNWVATNNCFFSKKFLACQKFFLILNLQA